MATEARLGWQVAVLCGVQFVDVLGVTSAITAIPAMLVGVSAPVAATPIVATAYAMFFGGLLVLGARLGDRYGHRRVLIIGTVSFVVAGLVGGAAQEIVQLIAGRALQGAAAAISVPCALRLLLDATPDEGARRGALAVWSASGAAAGALGFLVGGVLTQSLSWRAVFWINVPVGLLLLLAIVVVVPPSKPEHDPAPLDLVGAVFLVTSVMALIVGASLIEDPHRRGLGGVLVAAGLGLGFVLVAHQRRSSAPLLPRAAFASANLRTGTTLSFVNTASTTSAGVLATLLLQQQFNVSAIGAGFALLPFSLGVIAGSALSKPLGAHLSGRRLAVGGLAAIAAGNVILAITYGSIVGIVVGVVVAGTGLGLASVAANAIGTDVADGMRGTATGVLNTGAQLGSAIGVAALVVCAATVHGPWPGTAIAWGVAAGLAALAVVPLLRKANVARDEVALEQG